MNKRRFYYSLPVILLLIVAVAGWLATDYLGNKARDEIIEESRSSALTVYIYVSSTLNNLEGAVKSLAGSPWITPALMSKGGQDIEHANSALDRYNSATNASVTYLMDTDGMTVASSNRKDPDSFLGKSYQFRPYFQEAARGQAGRYFAVGITSGKRGFYASYPIQNRPGNVVGAVTMKKDLDNIEIFFSKYPFCFLISPDGIIFLSSTPAMALKTLWPLDKTTQEKLIASRQFGNKLSETVLLKKEIADGTEVILEGNAYFVSRKTIDSDGWSIVLLTPTDRIRLYTLLGILAAISTGFLIIVFSGIIYFKDQSEEVIRHSEESKRLLLHAVGDGIFGVDAAGRVTFVNPAALRVLGYSVEEMTGQRVHALIHHSRADGSSYPVEDCPMYASYARAVDSHVAVEVLWRKDGSSFPAEYSSMPITKDGKIMGAVVTFKDITERKQAEEKVKKSESLLKEAQHLAHIGHWELDPAIGTPAWSEEIFHIFGLDPAQGEPSLEDHRKIIHPDDWDIFNNAITQSGIEGTLFDIEFRIVRPDKSIRWMNAKGYVTRDNEGNIVRLFGTAQDITERKYLEQQLHTMSLTDELTGLYNRRGFFTLAQQQMKVTERTKKDMLLFFVDLDKMKQINDTLGHQEGDKALVEIAAILKEVFRESDIIGRMGGDEFAILAIDTTDETREVLIDRLHNSIDDYNRPEGRNYQLSLSIGIAHYNPETPSTLDELMAQADTLMYEEKRGKAVNSGNA